MPRLRTSERWRLEEARRMGWVAWYWKDEYKEQRAGNSKYFYHENDAPS